jgi:hypothetical protein
MVRPKFSWNEYFTPVTTLSSREYNSRQTLLGSSVYVLNCLFNKCTSENVGGAMYCTSATFLLVEATSFESCKTSAADGGAIYYSNTGGGQSVLHRVCGSDCFSTFTSNISRGQFSYIMVNNDGSSKNYVNYSSTVRCVSQNLKSHCTMHLYFGKICCPSVNSSMNKFQYYPGIFCHPFNDLSYVTCSLSYSSFTDNNASGHICIGFNVDAKYEIKYCNILRNTQGYLNSFGLIYAPGNLIIENSCILENDANYIFYFWSSHVITLSNCTIDKTTSNGNLNIQNTITKSFILGLHHISTQNCYSEYDSIGILTAVPCVSRPTKKVYCYCYTSKINQYQATLSDFLSSTLLFIFMFIHSKPIGD